MTVERTGSAYSVDRWVGAKEETATLPDEPALQAVLAEMATTCTMIKVGYGYYDVHLTVDAGGRVSAISQILIEDNPDAPTL